ncbi:MAG TPA: MEDS domain-containing protein [Telluria sp.]|nr:MEDS domain-containing protein [Telluria sp.]
MNQESISKRKRIDVFWGESSACDHTVQIYEDDGAFLDALEGFVAGGIRQGDAIILIATPAHLAGLEMRLESSGFDVGAAIVRDQYIAVDARRALASFMIDGWPDEALFHKFVDGLLLRAKGRHRKVRAFGEMVALMWAEGQSSATVRLEHLWTRLVLQESFSLFCAYPKTGFADDADDGIAEVCAAHSRLYAI